MIIGISIATFIATLLGGFLALRFRDKLHLILGFSAGAVLAVAFFDLIPESIELAKSFHDVSTVSTIIAVGFFVYLILDRWVFLHVHNDEHEVPVGVQKRGILGASTLCVHSLFDGIAIGLAFQVSISVGIVVAIAVLIHDFSDGVNTINIILKNNGDRKEAFIWLFVDAIAPVVGIISTMFFTLNQSVLAMILSLFAGFFLYIGASDLIPESHHNHPKFMTTAMTLLGAVVMYIAIMFAGV